MRTIDVRRVTALQIGGRERLVTDPGIRAAVRQALARHLGLDLLAALDGAA